jgi:hypothetical protein
VARKLEVEIIGDASSMRRAVGDAEKATGRFGGKLGGLGKTAALTAGAAGLGALVGGLKMSIGEFQESQRVGAQTNAVLKSTHGAAKITATEIGNLAGAISKKSGIDDEAIQSGENLLLTFTKVRNETGKGNDIFNQATQTITDMSVALGQDTKTSAIQLGKALNDPIKGITALQRVGVSFTAQQKEQIKTLVQHGDTLKAQKLILGELSSEFGGSATAAGQTFEGQINKLKVAVGNIMEAIGGALVPVLLTLGTTIEGVVGWFREHEGIAIALGVAIGLVTGVLVIYGTAMFAVEVATKAARIATALYTAAQWALNASMLANPIGAVVLALAALAAGFVIAYTKINGFHDAVNNTFNWIKDHWPLIVSIMTGPIGAAVIAIIRNFDDIKTGITNTLGAVRSAVSAGMNAVISTIHDFAEAFIDVGAWIVNRIAGGFRGVTELLGSIGGWLRNQVLELVHNEITHFTNLGEWITGTIAGGIKGAIDAVKDAANWLKDKIVGAVKDVFGIDSPSKVMMELGSNIATGLIKGVIGEDVGGFIKRELGGATNLVSSLGSKAVKFFGGLFGGGGSASGDNADNMTLGRMMMLAAGFPANQWPALKALWQGESGWNQFADNPTSDAYGIPQALPGSKMAAAGADWRTSPRTQIAWGLGYIKSVYGTPSNAYAQWLSRAPHWYAKGGDFITRGPTVFGAGEAGPERVTIGPANGNGGATVVHEHHYHGPVMQDKDFLTYLRNIDRNFGRQNARPAFGG